MADLNIVTIPSLPASIAEKDTDLLVLHQDTHANKWSLAKFKAYVASLIPTPPSSSAPKLVGMVIINKDGVIISNPVLAPKKGLISSIDNVSQEGKGWRRVIFTRPLSLATHYVTYVVGGTGGYGTASQAFDSYFDYTGTVGNATFLLMDNFEFVITNGDIGQNVPCMVQVWEY